LRKFSVSAHEVFAQYISPINIFAIDKHQVLVIT
jgi:hypothetical protein